MTYSWNFYGNHQRFYHPMDIPWPFLCRLWQIHIYYLQALLQENQNHTVPSTVLRCNSQSKSLQKGTEYTLGRVQNEHCDNKAVVPGINKLAVCGIHTVLCVMLTEVWAVPVLHSCADVLPVFYGSPHLPYSFWWIWWPEAPQDAEAS